MNPKKMNITLKIILVGIVVLTGLGLYFANQRMTALASKTSKLKAEIEFTNQKLDNYQLTKTKIDELSYVNDLAAKILPNTEEQSSIVAELAEFARRSNLSTGEIAFADTATVNKVGTKTKAAAPKGVQVVPVTFAVSGSAKYEDVLSFLRYIEDNRRKMQVTQVSLTPSSNNGDQLDNVSLTLNLFVKTPKSGAKK